MLVHQGLETAHLLGADWTHFNAPGSWPRRRRIVMHGTNSTHISRPVLITLMLKELLNPDVLVPVSTMQTHNWHCSRSMHAHFLHLQQCIQLCWKKLLLARMPLT